jgi:hypothetical protein
MATFVHCRHQTLMPSVTTRYATGVNRHLCLKPPATAGVNRHLCLDIAYP